MFGEGAVPAVAAGVVVGCARSAATGAGAAVQRASFISLKHLEQQSPVALLPCDMVEIVEVVGGKVQYSADLVTTPRSFDSRVWRGTRRSANTAISRAE